MFSELENLFGYIFFYMCVFKIYEYVYSNKLVIIIA